MNYRLSFLLAVSLWLTAKPILGNSISGDTKAKVHREWFIGVSYIQYSIPPEDRAFFINQNETHEAIGVHVNTTKDSESIISFMWDFEYQFGGVNRPFPWHPHTESTMRGVQVYYGPRLRLGHAPVSLHALGGVTWIYFSGADAWTCTPNSNVVIIYTGDDAGTRAWVDWFNNHRTSPTTVPGFPSFKRLKPAMNLGVDLTVASCVRLQLELISVIDHGLGKDLRVSLGYVFSKE